MFWTAILAAAALATQARAGAANLAGDGLLVRRSPLDLDQSLSGAKSEHAVRFVAERATTTMTTTAAGTDVILNADGTINMTAWDQTATQACNNALTRLPESSNPSGTCICYNLPALDNVTGAFEADLRLFQLSTPSGEFQGIPPENINVSLSYTSASVIPVTAQTVSRLVAGRAEQPVSNGTLRLLQQYLFVGQIKPAMMSAGITMAELEALVMPILTLRGTRTDGQQVSTNVSSNEAAFVAGVFSQTVVMSNTTMAQLAVNDIVNGLHNGTVAFVLPGVQLILFPIGLIITSIWLAIGVAVIGFGFIQRVQFRHMYRQRAMMSSKAGNTI